MNTFTKASTRDAILERLSRLSAPPDAKGCRIWQASSRYPNGGGQLKLDGRTVRAHRTAWELENGAIPEGSVLWNTCGSRLCITPEHWRLVAADMSGPDHPNWRGGRKMDKEGYALVNVGRDHPMARSDGYVAEHRLVLSKEMGRVLTAEEVVHHLAPADVTDNRPTNLLLIANQAAHRRLHALYRKLPVELAEIRRTLKRPSSKKRPARSAVGAGPVDR